MSHLVPATLQNAVCLFGAPGHPLATKSQLWHLLHENSSEDEQHNGSESETESDATSNRRARNSIDLFVIKCKNVWVWKNSCLSCLSGMTLKSVMHVTQELRFSVMQKRSLSCRIGNT